MFSDRGQFVGRRRLWKHLGVFQFSSRAVSYNFLTTFNFCGMPNSIQIKIKKKKTQWNPSTGVQKWIFPLSPTSILNPTTCANGKNCGIAENRPNLNDAVSIELLWLLLINFSFVLQISTSVKTVSTAVQTTLCVWIRMALTTANVSPASRAMEELAWVCGCSKVICCLQPSFLRACHRLRIYFKVFLRFCPICTKRYQITSQARVKRVTLIRHRTIFILLKTDFSGCQPAIPSSISWSFIVFFVPLPLFRKKKN